MLMKKIVLAALAALLLSCGLEEVSRRPGYGAGNIWVRPGAGSGNDVGNEPGNGNPGKEDEGKTVTYITAVDYPEGYDWRLDREKGTVKCSLLVYADDRIVMKVPVGDSHEVSSDPDMHRMTGGHLYTDFSTDSETVIKKDGEEVVRYQGREMICDIVDHGNNIYTLGHDRDGDGFTYRRNGEILLERIEGRSFGRLYVDGNTLSFAFAEAVTSAGDTLERYYIFSGGKVVQTAVRDDIRRVWDIVLDKGESSYLASVVGIGAPVLFTSGRMQALSLPQSAKALAGRIVGEGESLFVEGLVLDGGVMTGGVWNGEGEALVYEAGMTVNAVCSGGEGLHCVLSDTADPTKGVIYRGGERFPVPEGYMVMGNSPAALVKGILNVGLSPLNGSQPLVWKDGETTPLKINGFISSIMISM